MKWASNAARLFLVVWALQAITIGESSSAQQAKSAPFTRRVGIRAHLRALFFSPHGRSFYENDNGAPMIPV
jgi:hypothetical protein